MIKPDQANPYFPWDFIKIKCITDDDLREPFPAGLCFRLLMVSSGAGIVATGGKHLPFSSPAVFCLNDRETLQIITPGKIETLALHFDPVWLNPNFTLDNLHSSDFQSKSVNDIQDQYYLYSFLTRKEGYYGLLSCSPETFICLRENFEAIDKQIKGKPDDYWPCRSRSYFIQSLILVSNLFQLQVQAKEAGQAAVLKDDRLIAELLTYLHNNYAKDIQIQDLEHLFALNRTSLAERFKEATGQSIMSYLRNLRIRTASSLLQETYLPVNEICDRVGFNDLSHFGRTFREIYGLSPKEYRDQFCWVGK